MAEPWSSRVSSTIDMAASPTGSAHWIVHPASVTTGVATDVGRGHGHRGDRARQDREPGAAGPEARAERDPAGHGRRHDPVGPQPAAPPARARSARPRRRRRRRRRPRSGSGPKTMATERDDEPEDPEPDPRAVDVVDDRVAASEPLAALGARGRTRLPTRFGLALVDLLVGGLPPGGRLARAPSGRRLPTPAAAPPPRRRRRRRGRARRARRCTRSAQCSRRSLNAAP